MRNNLLYLSAIKALPTGDRDSSLSSLSTWLTSESLGSGAQPGVRTGARARLQRYPLTGGEGAQISASFGGRGGTQEKLIPDRAQTSGIDVFPTPSQSGEPDGNRLRAVVRKYEKFQFLLTTEFRVLLFLKTGEGLARENRRTRTHFWWRELLVQGCRAITATQNAF